MAVNTNGVSIVIPAYNARRYIAPMLRSIQRQSIAVQRIVVVDDGSTDGTERIVRRFARKDERIRYIRQENSGPAAARNRGMAYVETPWIMFADADDVLMPDAVKVLLKAAQEDDAEIVCGRFVAFRGRRTWRHEGTGEFGRLHAVTLHDHPELFADMSPWNKLFRTEFIKRHGIRFLDGVRLREDIFFVQSAMLHAQRISTVTETVYRYRASGAGALTMRMTAKALDDIVHVSEAIDKVQAAGVYASVPELMQLRYRYEVKALAFRLLPYLAESGLPPEALRRRLEAYLDRVGKDAVLPRSAAERVVLYKSARGAWQEARDYVRHTALYKVPPGRGGRILDRIGGMIKNGIWKFYVLLTEPLVRHTRKHRSGIWLVGERHGEGAEDTGWEFFRYCVKEHPERKVYFTTKRDVGDRAEAGRIVRYGSLRHHWYVWRADVFAFSDNYKDIFPYWPRMPIQRTPKVACFLQHGIFAFKRSDAYRSEAVRKRNERYDLIVVSSQKERQFVSEGFGFPSDAVTVTGLSRFDRLYRERELPSDRQILFAPTWRVDLRGADDAAYLKSNYHRTIAALASSSELLALLRRSGYRLVICFHHAAAAFSKHYENRGDTLVFTDMRRQDFDGLLRTSRLLITDYSSVAFDMIYLRRPVVFYRWDDTAVQIMEGGSFVHDDELFGPTVTSLEALIELLEYNISCHFTVAAEDMRRAKAFFAYRDDNNCRRIFDAIEARLERKKANG